MRPSRWGLALGLSNPVAFVHAMHEVNTVTVRVPTGTCLPGAFTGTLTNGGPGSGSGSGPPKLVSTIDSSFGSYTLQGCYDSSAPGFVIKESTTGSSITLEGCAASCKGSPYLAVVNGNTCNCLSSGPSGLGVDIGEFGCMATCTGSSSQCCGSRGYGIVYHCPTCGSGSGGSTTIIFTTTDSNGSTITGTTTSALPSATVIVETTTDSKGSTFMTSTTSTMPVSSPSTSVIVATSTDSEGSVFTTSSTSTASPAPTGSVILVTSSETVITTDPRGSTVTSISTAVTLSTATATSLPTPAIDPGIPTGPSDCTPGEVTDGLGQQYEIYCGVDFPGNDLITPNVATFAECLIACDQYVPSPSVGNNAACVAVSYGYGNVGGNCYLKSAITTANIGNAGFDSARLLSYIPRAFPQIVSTRPGGQSSAPVVGPTTPVVIPGPVATTPTTPVGPVGPIDTAAITFPCPAFDGAAYIDPSGEAYQIECGANYPGNDLTAINRETFKDCILACDAYVPSPNVGGGLPCIGVSWGRGNPGGNCYLKSAITAGSTVYGTGLDSAYKVSYPKPGQTITPTTPAVIVSVSAALPPPGSSLVVALPPSVSSLAALPPVVSSLAVLPPAVSSLAALPPVVSSLAPLPPAVSSLAALPPAVSSIAPLPPAVSSLAASPPAVSLSSLAALPPAISSLAPLPPAVSSLAPLPPAVSSVAPLPPAVSSVAPVPPAVSSVAPLPPAVSSLAPPPPIVVAPLPGAPLGGGVLVGPPATSVSSGPAPVQTITTPPVCPLNNNTRYANVFGTTYGVTCGRELVGVNGKPLHADTVEECLQFCDILKGCAGITGAFPPPPAAQPNCYPYSTFSGYGGTAPSGVFAGVPVNGPTTNQVGQGVLCPGFDGQTYTDIFGSTYRIGCGSNLGGNNLYATQTNTLQGCLTYCTNYDTCLGVVFLGVEGGPLPLDQAANCFPKSTIGVQTPQADASFAIRVLV